MFQSKRIVLPVAAVVLLALPFLLSGCGNPLAAAPASTATPIPPTATPAPPTDTPPPTSTPGPTPTPTPRPLDVHVRSVAFPDASAGSLGGTQVLVAARSPRVVTATQGVVRVVDAVSGRVLGPITVTASGDSLSLALDAAHGRVDAVLDGTYSMSPTLTTIDVVSGRALRQRPLTALPGAVFGAALADPASGDLIVSTNHTSSYPTDIPGQLVRLTVNGVVRRRHELADDVSNLYLDPAAGVVVAIAPTTTQTPTITGYSLRTLAPLWTRPLPYMPLVMTLDLVHSRFWLLAEGGRVTVYDLRTGRIVGACDPVYTKPASWASNKDLVVDPRTGLGYASWRGGPTATDVHDAIDVITPTAGIRTLLTDGGGVLAGVAARTGGLISHDAQSDLVLRDSRGQVLGTLAPAAQWLGADNTTYGPTDLVGTVVAQDGDTVVIAHAATVPYQDPVSGSTTAPGVVAVVYRDRP